MPATQFVQRRRPNNSPLSAEQTAAAWVFITEHYNAISKRAWRLAGSDARIEGDELFAESILWIVRNHRSYNPLLSPAEAWIYQLVRRARMDMLEKLNRRATIETSLDAFDSISNDGESVGLAALMLTDHGQQAQHTEVLTRLGRALSAADDETLACAQSVLDEHTAAEAADFLGDDLANRRMSVLRSVGQPTVTL